MQLALYVYDEPGAQAAFRLLHRLRQRLAWQAICVVYRAALALPMLEQLARRHGVDGDCTYLPYDGREWEFHAYQLALNALVPSASGLLVLNDTAARNYPFFEDDLRRLGQQIALAAEEQQPILIGKIEQARQSFSLAGLTFDRWVRSNLFYLNQAALQALRHTVYEPEVFAAPRYEHGRLLLGMAASSALEQHLARWMSTDPADDGWLVHSGRPGIGTEVLRGKTGSILLEKRLSSRVLAAGGALRSYEPATPSWWHRLRVKAFFAYRSRRRRWLGRLAG